MIEIGKNVRPTSCCKVGTFECQVPMAVNGRIHGVDYCIADVVAALNAANIRTKASCCGHGVAPGTIHIDDGRVLEVKHGVRPWENYVEVEP